MQIEGELPSFEGATEWLNSEPLTPQVLRGRVVLVSFGTFTCINWIRSLPYVRAWADKYADQGLAVIGVQTPEFEVERNVDNVRRSLKQMDVRYPTVVDNDYAIWHAFDNHYWPAQYFVDAKDRIRHHRFGEGEYEESERVLQALLAEAGVEEVESSLVRLDPQGVEAPPDWGSLRTPETYMGYGRAERFAPAGGLFPDERHAYTMPPRLGHNVWSLAGDWRIGQELALLSEPGGAISIRFHARDVHLVMGAKFQQVPLRYRVSLDGEPPERDHGLDVDEEGLGVVSHTRLYQLIRHTQAVTERSFEIEFLDPGVEAFVFTFG
jgi:hypothetical protein